MHKFVTSWWWFAWAFVALPALATEGRAINVDIYQAAILQASGHPNELSRWRGIWNYDNGCTLEAYQHFERAAYYGDKLLQHFLSLMFWKGDGVGRDLMIAYIWADLAAERENNETLVRVRERIWSELSYAQQQKAVEVGRRYFYRYGDRAATRRANTEMRRFMRSQTGSRVGLLTSRLDVNLGHPELWADGSKSTFGQYSAIGSGFYADSRTRSAAYWISEDLSLRDLIGRIGTVNVGEVENVELPIHNPVNSALPKRYARWRYTSGRRWLADRQLTNRRCK